MSKKHMGSSIDDFLKEQGILRRRRRKRSRRSWLGNSPRQ